MTVTNRIDLPARIAAWLPAARWFAGKGSAIEAVSLADECPLPGGLVLALVDVAAAGEPLRFAVPLDPRDGSDAAATPAFAGWLVDQVAAGRTTATRHGCFIGHPAGPAPHVTQAATGTPVVSAVGGDASNTSLRVGTAAGDLIVKLIRRCRSGVQPEVEVGGVLAMLGGRPVAPAFRGWLEYHDAAGRSTAIATVHAFLPGRTTAWDELLGLVASGGLAGPSRERILAIVGALGAKTARMHAAFAAASGEDFVPRTIAAAERQAEAAAMADRAARVLATAPSRVAPASPLAARLARLAADGVRITDRLRTAATVDLGAIAIRIHGDYHLGQVLLDPTRLDGDPLVIDFEGEPGRPLEERRRRSSGCRDVAGMIRSFDYLVRCAARAGGSTVAAGDRDHLVATFVAAYAADAAGQPWWPAGDPAPAIAIFALDKAISELAYELAHRPDWVAVPLAALEEFIGSSPDPLCREARSAS
jgi:maltose alpha-D-glucosyltransferase/alpha-amylase